MQSSLVLQRIDGLDPTEVWSYNRYVLPATSIYLEDHPDVIQRRLQERPALTRLEATGSPAKELQLYGKPPGTYAATTGNNTPSTATDSTRSR